MFAGTRLAAGLRRRGAALAGFLAVVLVATMVGQVPAVAAPEAWKPPAPKDVAGVPVRNVKPAGLAGSLHGAVVRPMRVAWPAAATATLETAVGETAGMPVRVAAAPGGAGAGIAPGRRPSRVSVTVHDRAATAKAAVSGVLLSLSGADGVAAGPVAVEVRYSSFADAYGGDWASRLALWRLPACAVSTPEVEGCRVGSRVVSSNNPVTGTVSGQVSVSSAEPSVLALQADPVGDNGSYTATSLSSAGAWEVSPQTGDFSWRYDLRMPPALGGPAPSVSLAYSSGSVDGRTGASNNQGGWVGDGWDSWPGFIERRYASCSDDNPSHKTGDQCWAGENATLSLNGRAGDLIQSGGIWRMKHDDGTKVEKVAGDASRTNGDNDHEYWKVTTTDGTQYFFGYHRLPGWVANKPVTDSVWTVPVYGNNTLEPCNKPTFAASWCDQGWRWNLDYVVDPRGNTMAYFYGKETGWYGRDNTGSQRTPYIRGGWLDRIEYGMRSGQEYTQAAPLRVTFGTAERCLSACWAGAAWQSAPTVANWKDTPWDLDCNVAPCKNTQLSPTFWSARRLTKVTAQTRNGASSYADVESWTLRQEFPDAGNHEGKPMWLAGITRTGTVTTAGGTAVSDPEITFGHGAEALPNRVDGPADGRTALNRWRVKQVNNESGGQLIITYSPASDCSRAALPNPQFNASRCMPAYYAPPSTGTPTLDWFHKYVVTRVDADDLVTDQPNQSTFYDYPEGAAWHYTDDEITPAKFKTWGDWRGYARVQVRTGDPAGQQTAVEYRYLRGMHGDKLSSGTRNVSLPDSWGGSTVDHQALNGFVLQQITFNGPNGAEVQSTLNQPWIHGPTATRTRNDVTTNAFKTNTASTRTRTALATGGFRIARTASEFNTDGFVVKQDNVGDEAVPGDETCTRTSYARNDTVWMIDKVSQTETLSGTCAAAATPAGPATVLARIRNFYDTYLNESSFGAPPTAGNVVRTEELDRFNGSIPVYVATASTGYDPNGRPTSVTDVRGHTTTTVYTTANGGLVTETKVTSPLGHQVTTVKEPAWDLPTKTTDANGAVTELTYDGLGRLLNVWLPGRAKSTPTPSLRFSYLPRKSGGPTAVTTENLLPSGAAYKTSVNLYDGFLRQRQMQTQATGGGRLLTDTSYHTNGKTAWTSAAYYDSTNAAPGTALGIPQGQIPAITEHHYDGAGRKTAEVFKALGAVKWRTTSDYGGDRTHTTPPLGGTATTAITDVYDRTVKLRQYKNPADVGSTDPAKYHETQYGYDLEGALTKLTDPAGNQWTYSYDLRGRQKSATDPDKGVATSTYDVAGNLETVTDPTGDVLAYTYDQIGRKTSLREGSVTGPKRAEWVYDTLANGKGKVTKSIRWHNGDAYENRVDAYDVFGRPTSTSVVLPATAGALCASAAPTPCVYTTAVTYKANGSTSTSTLPQAADLASEKLTFGYNDIGEHTTLFSPLQIYVYSATYDKLGQLAQREFGAFGSRVAVTSQFDEPTRRLKSTSIVAELKPEAGNYGYEYDNASNLTKVSDATAGQSADHQCFRYDHLRRLTTAWTPTGGNCAATPSAASLAGPAPYLHEWNYDAIGNRTRETRRATGGDTTYTYTIPTSGPTAVRPHTVTSITAAGPGLSWTRGFTYDNTGNTKTRMSDAGNLQTLNWTKEGLLDNLVEAGQTTSFIYDADGNRLVRKEASRNTLYLPDGTEVSAGTATGSTATGTRYYSHKDTPIAVRAAGILHWLVGDQHGTTQLTIKSTDLTVNKRRQLPFGQDRGAPPGGWPTAMDKGFVGGTKDPTGLTHLGAREYDPAIGRFISVDPVIDVTDPQQLHGYAYSNNNPITYSDPDGELFGGLKKLGSKVASAASTVGNAVAKAATNVVQSIKEDPLKFAVGLAVGIAVAVAVAAVCATGVGCLILAGAAAGAAAAGAEYGVDVAQGEREFSVKDLGKEMALGAAVGAVGAGAGVAATKVISKARSGMRGRGTEDFGDEAADAGRHADDASPPPCSRPAVAANSFAPGTAIVMADGSIKPIELVAVGDRVLAADPHTGDVTAEEVVATITGTGQKQLVDLTVDTGDGTSANVTATEGHPIWVANRGDGEWVAAGGIEIGDELLSPDGSRVRVLAVVAYGALAAVHNLTIDTEHTYYVGAGKAAALVHNATPHGPSCPVSMFPDRPEGDCTCKDRTRWSDLREAERRKRQGEEIAETRTHKEAPAGASGQFTKALDDANPINVGFFLAIALARSIQWITNRLRGPKPQ
jgi:RHS repeat-associated protein